MSWPTRFGTLGEKVFGEGDPFNECAGESHAITSFSSDEIPPTASPLDPKGPKFTSKAAIRAFHKSRGFEEVGTAYDNGYDPEKSREYEAKRAAEARKCEIIEFNNTAGRERLKEVLDLRRQSMERWNKNRG